MPHDNIDMLSLQMCHFGKLRHFPLSWIKENTYILTRYFMVLPYPKCTTIWYWSMICVGNLTIIVSDNGLSPYRRQAIIWTNAGILLIGPLGTNVGEILIKILTLSFKKMRLKVSSAKCRAFCLGLNVLTPQPTLKNNPGTFVFLPICVCKDFNLCNRGIN